MIIGAAEIAPIAAETQDKGFRSVSEKPDQSNEVPSGKRWALLVGIADYPSVEGFEIQKLKGPVKDINALAAFLTDPETGGYDPEYVFTLTNEEATKRNILMKLDDIRNSARPEDMVLFFFSGHGAPPPSDSYSSYLIPYDHDLRYLDATCIDSEELASTIRKMEAKKVIVILDACHTGGVKQYGAKAGAVGNTGVIESYKEAFQKAEGQALLLSSDESEVSLEDEEGGIFTRFLLEGLSGKADSDNNGIVTFEEVSLYVVEEVPRYTRENFSRSQQPARRYYPGPVRNQIPMAINRSKVNTQIQKKLLDDRNAAILRATLAGLNEELQEFSFQVAKSAHDKALKEEELTKRESLLLQQLDRLKDGTIKPEDYITRVPPIYSMGSTQLRISVTPADAKVTLTPVNAPNNVISATQPNTYKVDFGSYCLLVQKQGYKPYTSELTLDQASKQVSVTLERLTGTLKLWIGPADATVTVTPLDAAAAQPITAQATDEKKLPVGAYRVKAEKEGYKAAVREPVEIKANTSTQLTLTLNKIQPPVKQPQLIKEKPPLAKIVAPDLPGGTRVLINGSPVKLPHELPPGEYEIHLEREGFEPVDMSETLAAAQTFSLSPRWTPITPPELMPKISRGIPPTTAFAASLAVPGLGQHLQKRHIRGMAHEAVVISAGAATVWSLINYSGKLDDYEKVRRELQTAEEQYLSGQITVQDPAAFKDKIRDIVRKQDDAYNKAKSARKLTIAMQVALGVIWGINALDAGVTAPAQPTEGLAFEAYPTADGGQIVVYVTF